MITRSKNNKSAPLDQQRGFALIASISIMAVLVLIAVTLYSLSNVATRSATLTSARAEAQANAKMALLQAIGKLQSELGPDQRISANAAVLDGNPDSTSIDNVANQHWLGVWESWKAGEDAGSGHNTIQGVNSTDIHMSPTYEEGRESYFRSWLISMDPAGSNNLQTARGKLVSNPSVRPNKTNDSVTLVGESSASNENSSSSDEEAYVHVPLVNIGDNAQSQPKGRFAWWIGDESQKARIMSDPYDSTSESLSSADKIFKQYAPGAVATKILSGLENINEEDLDRLVDFTSLNLLEGVDGDTPPTKANFHHATTRSLGVIADVREGGLKRDLNTLLEQPIDTDDTEMIDEFMLYSFEDPRFDERKHSQVPIQDLSAYYQLYQDDPDFNSDRRGGVEFERSSIKVTAPDFGENSANDNEVEEQYLREYTTLYRNPVPIRVQFIVGAYAQPITADERQNLGSRRRGTPIPESLTHKMIIGITPVLTLWNPNNVTMTLRRGDAYSQVLKMTSPAFYIEWTKFGAKGTTTTNPVNLMFMAAGHNSWHNYSEIASLALSDNAEVTFEPGEIKIFSIPVDINTPLVDRPVYLSGAHGRGIQSAEPGWDANGLLPLVHSASNGPDVYEFYDPDVNIPEVRSKNRRLLCFGDGTGAEATDEFITFGIYPEGSSGQENVSGASKVGGSAFNFWLINRPYTQWKSNKSGEHLMNYMFTTRAGADIIPGGNRVNLNTNIIPFNQDFMAMAFPNGDSIEPEGTGSESISGSQLVRATQAGETITLFQFTMTAASEVSGDNMSFANAGRKRPTRPFLHASTLSPPFIDQIDPSSLYTYGWEWQIEGINSMDEAPVQNDDEMSFYGGGYTPEYGNTHVVQREIPTVPPISIASLSHTHLGGFSLGNEPPLEFSNSQGKGMKRMLRDITRSQAYQRVTAHGFAGLAPHTLQAIGNSYAHPKVPSDKAFSTWSRYFDIDESTPRQMEFIDTQPYAWGGRYEVPCVDHSYLVNKALWDEYFFSSITPHPSSSDNPLFGDGQKTAEQVAEDFFFNDTPLPNRRYVPYKKNLTEGGLSSLFSSDPLSEDGPFENLSSYMMVKGPFNVNSTSTEAWKAFLASHRDSVVQYYDGKSSLPQELNADDTPVGYGGMANLNTLAQTSDTADAKLQEQWRTWRSITDDEIEQLAKAIVRQVKLRGPFLSLSEFVNRRLEQHNPGTELSLKGALQAALDFEGAGDIQEVTINREFRSDNRSLDSEIDSSLASVSEYPEALDGPVAYGSAPYVDQADLLRSFAGQLTPRGDTFVIRAYGDSLNASGEVLGRAWCEAVVQRSPEYLEDDDPDYTPTEELTSDANETFGRKFHIISFRWLNDKEV